MTSALPAHPDLEHLRREAKRLLRGLQAGDPDALARGNAHAPRLAVALATAQLVVAREHGFASWAQLRAVVERLSCGGIRYDRIGRGYAGYRRTDPRLAAAVHAALGPPSNVRTIVNVGAGTGSYEPADRPVIPVEPSTAMALQRDAALPPAVLGVAESLPLADGTADAATAVMTMHHWADVRRGLAELVRVARRRIVLLTIDAEVQAGMWLFTDYVPEMAERERHEMPAIDWLVAELGAVARAVSVTKVPVPSDCWDGLGLAFWSRPEAVLDPGARAATSGFARMDDGAEEAVVARLAADLASGAWDARHGHLRSLPSLDVGLRLVVADLV